MNSKASWTEVNEILSKKIDMETVTNALQKKVNVNDFSTFEAQMEEKIQKIENNFKSKLEEVIEAQEQVLKIVENENEIHHKKLNRKNPQLEEIRMKLDMKLDRREIDTFTQECVNNVDRVRDEVEEIVKSLTEQLEDHKENNGKIL